MKSGDDGPLAAGPGQICSSVIKQQRRVNDAAVVRSRVKISSVSDAGRHSAMAGMLFERFRPESPDEPCRP